MNTLEKTQPNTVYLIKQKYNVDIPLRSGYLTQNDINEFLKDNNITEDELYGKGIDETINEQRNDEPSTNKRGRKPKSTEV